jgi:hypothetical protein
LAVRALSSAGRDAGLMSGDIYRELATPFWRAVHEEATRRPYRTGRIE